MSKVYKPIDLVSTENNYKAYAVITNGGKETIFLRNSQELKKLFEECSEDELVIYTLQSVVRAEEINDSSNDDYDDSESDSGEINIDNVIDEVTKAFSNSLKEIVSKIK